MIQGTIQRYIENTCSETTQGYIWPMLVSALMTMQAAWNYERKPASAIRQSASVTLRSWLTWCLYVTARCVLAQCRIELGYCLPTCPMKLSIEFMIGSSRRNQHLLIWSTDDRYGMVSSHRRFITMRNLLETGAQQAY